MQKQALEPSNINKMIFDIKIFSIFQIFEKSVIDIKLEKNANYVKQVGKTDNIVNMYSQIEWIWSNISDKRKNLIKDIIVSTIEQVVIMFISGWLWGLAVEAYDGLKLLEWAWKLWGFLVKWWAVVLEWTTYYASYNAINWIVNQENYQDILKSYNVYDLTRSIAFLGVLKHFPWLKNLKQKITSKDTFGQIQQNCCRYNCNTMNRY